MLRKEKALVSGLRKEAEAQGGHRIPNCLRRLLCRPARQDCPSRLPNKHIAQTAPGPRPPLQVRRDAVALLRDEALADSESPVESLPLSWQR